MIKQRSHKTILIGTLCATTAFFISGCDSEEEELSPSAAYQQSLELAEEGNVDSIFDLAYAYSRGLGTDKNIDKAYQKLQEAAKQGHGRAQLVLAEIYLQANRNNQRDDMIRIMDDWYSVSSPDLDKGLKWLFKAELNEDKSISGPAEGILVAMVKEMEGSDRQKFFELAADYGHPEWQEVAKKYSGANNDVVGDKKEVGGS